MSCQLTVHSFSGVGSPSSGTFSSVHVVAGLTECNSATVELYSIGATTPLASATVSDVQDGIDVTLGSQGRFKCDNRYRIRVRCNDPGSSCDQFEDLLLPCTPPPPSCCVDMEIVASTPSRCAPNGTRTVNFVVSGTITEATCLPYVIQVDHGDGSLSAAQLISSTGPFSLTLSHDYAANGPTQSYTVDVVDITHPACPPIGSTTTRIQPCTPDCCPVITEVTITPGKCNGDCRREITLSTAFDGYAAPCSPAFMQWEIHDAAGNLVWNGSAFVSSTAGTAQDTFLVEPEDGPFTAHLTVAHPDGCEQREESFDVKPCNSKPRCPEIHELRVEDRGCQLHRGKCKRKMLIRFEVTIYPGCGDEAGETTFELDYGDGSTESIPVQFTGEGTIGQEHFYESSGEVTITLGVSEPSPCPARRTLTAKIPKCDPKDCEEIDPPKCSKCTSMVGYLQASLGALGWGTTAIKARIDKCCLWVSLLAFLFALTLVATFFCLHSGGPGQSSGSGTNSGLAALFEILGWGITSIYVIFLFLVTRQCGPCAVYCAHRLGLLIALILTILAWLIFGPPQCMLWAGVFAILGALVLIRLSKRECDKGP